MAALSVAPVARAARALDEPAALARLARTSSKTTTDTALHTAGNGERCASALDAPGLLGLECRAVVALAAVQGRALQKGDAVAARVALSEDLLKAATSVRSFEPLAPAPGFARQRFETHRALSRGVMALMDELGAVPVDSGAHQKATLALAGPPRRKDAACLAVRGSLELADGADASLQERGELQAVLTSHRCFLDESRLGGERKPAAAVRSMAGAVGTGTGANDIEQLRQYAESRALELSRCTSKLTDAAGRVLDDKKLEECSCGVIKRWSFPARTGEIATTLPVVKDTMDMAVTVAGNGRVTSCGPLQGRGK